MLVLLYTTLTDCIALITMMMLVTNAVVSKSGAALAGSSSSARAVVRAMPTSLGRRGTRRMRPSQAAPPPVCFRWFSSSTADSTSTFAAAPPSETSNNTSNNMKDVRTDLLQSALKHVHEFGWTQDAVAAAAAEKGASISLAGMIQPDELVAFSMDHWNNTLLQDLAAKRDIWIELDTPLASRVQEALKTRLSYVLPFVGSRRWHEGMAMGVANPVSALVTKNQVAQLIQICAESCVTDASAPSLTDWEQITLGGVYVATELHLLTDQSADYQDTWEFLQERVTEWERLTRDGAMSLDPTVMMQRGGDAMYTATAVASSLAGGVVSLVQPSAAAATAAGIASLPEQLWNTILKQAPLPPPTSSSTGSSASSTRSTIKRDGTDPSHYTKEHV